MKRTLTRTVRLVAVLGVVAALSFGVQQAVASSATTNSTSCTCTFPNNDECDDCCGGDGFCTTAGICLC